MIDKSSAIKYHFKGWARDAFTLGILKHLDFHRWQETLFYAPSSD
jgi:hypothetical protein